MNYTEMITVLNLNPKSSRKTNYNIINSFCQTENDGHKIRLTYLPEINCEKIYVLFDPEWEKTYITDTYIINEFENEQKSIFKDICDASNKSILKVRDLIFFKTESNEYYQKSLEYLRRRINRNTVKFEQGYRISINENITYEPLGLSINEIRERISNKFHQTMVTHIKNQRKKFCSVLEEQEIMNIAQMRIEKEKNDILYGKRSKKQAIQRASDDNIFNTGFINFLLR